MTTLLDVDVQQMLVETEDRHIRLYREAVADMLIGYVLGDGPGVDAARLRLHDLLVETMGIGELIGAAQVLAQAAGIMAREGGAEFAADRRDLLAFEATNNVLPRVSFWQALKAFAERVPVTVRNAAERTAAKIAALYSSGRVVAFVRAAEEAVTTRAKEVIEDAIERGKTEAWAGRLLKENVDEVRKETEAWTEGYSRMAFRTNLGTAVSAGRFRQVSDPDIASVIPCFRFDAMMDIDTRENHAAAHGLIFSTGNPVWNHIAPPLGYNCRCSVSLVSAPMLRRMGRLRPDGSFVEDALPSSAHPDPGFRHGGRPDLFTGP